MKKSTILRAWKDPMFRMSLSEEERSRLPSHPAGAASLDDRDLTRVAGGSTDSVCICTTTVYTTCCSDGTCL